MVDMLHAIDQLKAFLHASLIGQFVWLEKAVGGTIDLLTGPLTGMNTRYYWVYLLEALLLLAVVYTLRRPPGERPVRGFLRFCFPKGLYSHPSTLVDYQVNVANFFLGSSFKILWRVNSTLVASALVGLMVRAFGPAPHALHWTLPAIVGITILVSIADDFGYYVGHYALHRFRFLWAFHKVHHSAEVMTPLVAGRVHPVEMALTEPTRAAAMALAIAPAVYFFAGDVSFASLFGLNIVSLAFGAFGNQLLHSHVWISWGPKLDRIFVSPAVHQIHHSVEKRHWDRNLGGLLSVWDWMFGTLVLPTKGETITFGVGDGRPQPHTNVVAAYTVPFWEAIPFREKWMPLLNRVSARLMSRSTAAPPVWQAGSGDPARDLLAGD
jgi:sterol desaturase/sphingolipid hydroxylase (fatty acid hydroxylase superfamily)